jgi:dCTP deaminase
MILSDGEIRARASDGMIEPFVDYQVKSLPGGKRVISYGLSSYGYDIRTANEFKVFTPSYSPTIPVVDPKDFDERAFVTYKRVESVTIPPNSFALGVSLEYIRMPPDVTGIVLCKSTYIRCGILIPTTVLEAGWEGEITLEIANTTPLPAIVYANEGIAQILFFRGKLCLTSYADRNGKYQQQKGITLAEV